MARVWMILIVFLFVGCVNEPSESIEASVQSEVTVPQLCFSYICYPLDPPPGGGDGCEICNGHCPMYTQQQQDDCLWWAITGHCSTWSGEDWCPRHCDWNTGWPNFGVHCEIGHPN